MYFFYIDESGSRDPAVKATREDGTVIEKDHLYVLCAVALYEKKWGHFERAITNVKLEFLDNLRRRNQVALNFSDCEVKSTWLRIPKERKTHSQFLDLLTEQERTKIADTYYQQIADQHMIVFAVVIDKRCLREHMTAELVHKKAYELLLERIENYLREYHGNHLGVIVIDDTQRQLNRAVALKHAYFQREGNANVRFRHIVEYPFFTESTLSNGIQLADLCAYNVYRVFRNGDFSYPFFQRILPAIYRSEHTAPLKLDGLKIFPDNSKLVAFATEGYAKHQKNAPQENGGARHKPNGAGLGHPYRADKRHPTKKR